MGTAVHTAIDGNSVEIDAPTTEVPLPFSSEGVILVEASDHSFCSGLRNHGETVAVEPSFGAVSLDYEYHFQGGRLRIGSGPLPPTAEDDVYMSREPDGSIVPTERWVAVWEGQEFSFHTQTMGGPSQQTRLLNLLNRFTIREQVGGIVLGGNGGAAKYSQGPSVTKVVPGLASFDCLPRNSQTEKKVPRWGGTKVRGGQLYVAKRDTPYMYFVLAGESAITWIHPEGEGRRNNDYFLEHVSEAQIRWL